MRLKELHQPFLKQEDESWVVEFNKPGWPRGDDRYYQYDSYDEALAKATRFLDRYSTLSQSNQLNNLRNTGQAQLFDPDSNFLGWIKLYRGTAPLRGSITRSRIQRRREVNEYFGQTSGINQVSSYPQAQTSGKSLTPKEKRQLAKSKRCVGNKCPCWDCRTTADERVDRIKSHYNEAYEKSAHNQRRFGRPIYHALNVKLTPTGDYALEDIVQRVTDTAANLRWTIISQAAVRVSQAAHFTFRFDIREEAESAMKVLRRLGRGRPSFKIGDANISNVKLDPGSQRYRYHFDPLWIG